MPDRRGRGESGDATEYGLHREVADLLALVETVEGTPAVFGHSFGGLVALAAANEGDIDRLILYEPALLVGEHRERADLAARMQAALDDGDRREAMALFFREGGGVEEPERLPFWPDEVNFHLTETVVRENRGVEGYRLPEQPAIEVPTLLLTGEHGPEHLRDGVFELNDRLPDSRLVELEGAGHSAFTSSPELVASEIRDFLS